MSKILVARSGNLGFVKVVGRGSFQNAGCLKAFYERLLKDGANRFVVDLDACTYLDSTFLGTLLPLGRQLKNFGNGLHILNVSARNLELLRNLGLDRLIHIDGRPPASPNRQRQWRPRSAPGRPERRHRSRPRGNQLSRADPRGSGAEHPPGAPGADGIRPAQCSEVQGRGRVFTRRSWPAGPLMSARPSPASLPRPSFTLRPLGALVRDDKLPGLLQAADPPCFNRGPVPACDGRSSRDL